MAQRRFRLAAILDRSIDVFMLGTLLVIALRTSEGWARAASLGAAGLILVGWYAAWYLRRDEQAVAPPRRFGSSDP